MYYGKGSTSYNRSVVLSDDTILTVGAISTNPESQRSPTASLGSSYVTAIRWRPVRP